MTPSSCALLCLGKTGRWASHVASMCFCVQVCSQCVCGCMWQACVAVCMNVAAMAVHEVLHARVGRCCSCAVKPCLISCKALPFMDALLLTSFSTHDTLWPSVAVAMLICALLHTSVRIIILPRDCCQDSLLGCNCTASFTCCALLFTNLTNHRHQWGGRGAGVHACQWRQGLGCAGLPYQGLLGRLTPNVPRGWQDDSAPCGYEGVWTLVYF
jgi:hypothetical protein